MSLVTELNIRYGQKPHVLSYTLNAPPAMSVRSTSSDLKDLRFQKPAQKSEWPQRPNDPAILSVSFPTLPTYLPYLPSPLQETHTM